MHKRNKKEGIPCCYLRSTKSIWNHRSPFPETSLTAAVYTEPTHAGERPAGSGPAGVPAPRSPGRNGRGKPSGPRTAQTRRPAFQRRPSVGRPRLPASPRRASRPTRPPLAKRHANSFSVAPSAVGGECGPSTGSRGVSQQQGGRGHRPSSPHGVWGRGCAPAPPAAPGAPSHPRRPQCQGQGDPAQGRGAGGAC